MKSSFFGFRLAAFFVLFVITLGVLAPWVAPYTYDQQNVDQIFQGMSFQHWMGTDGLGRDLFSRILYGARISLTVGVLTAFVSLILGLIVGSLAAWFGGWVDALVMRGMDIFYSLPTLVLMILVKMVFDAYSTISHLEVRAIVGTVVALSLVGWVNLARLIRGQILKAKEEVYIDAVGALGPSGWRILLYHIYPNILGPVIVMIAYRIPSNILYESFLSFLGLGLQPPLSSWGVLAAGGADMLEIYPHVVLFPGAVLFLTMVAFQVLGDGLRDRLDAKGRSVNSAHLTSSMLSKH